MHAVAGHLHLNVFRILAVSFAHHHHKHQGEASNLEIPIALVFSHTLTSFLSKAVVHSTVLPPNTDEQAVQEQ